MEIPLKDSSQAAESVLRQMFANRQRHGPDDECAERSLPYRLIDFERFRRFDRLRPVAIGAAWRFLPIRRFDQSVFAEALRQALNERITIAEAIKLATEVNPCWCFRYLLRNMNIYVQSGDSLGEGLKKSKAWVNPGLLAALDVGEEYNCLREQLAVFVSRDRFFWASRYRRAIGRSSEAVSFAFALSGLLQDHRLSGDLVHAAGRISGDRKRHFVTAILQVSKEINDGSTLTDALKRRPRYFDPLFCRFLETVETREEMRACLERLGSAGNVT